MTTLHVVGYHEDLDGDLGAYISEKFVLMLILPLICTTRVLVKQGNGVVRIYRCGALAALIKPKTGRSVDIPVQEKVRVID